MSKKRFIFLLAAGIIIGLFIVSPILDWLGVSYTFANVLDFIFGEHHAIKRIIVVLLILALIFFVGRGLYKEYKKST